MTTSEFTCPCQVQEPKETYSTQAAPLVVKQAKVVASSYPPLKAKSALYAQG